MRQQRPTSRRDCIMMTGPVGYPGPVVLSAPAESGPAPTLPPAYAARLASGAMSTWSAWTGSGAPHSKAGQQTSSSTPCGRGQSQRPPTHGALAGVYALCDRQHACARMWDCKQLPVHAVQGVCLPHAARACLKAGSHMPCSTPHRPLLQDAGAGPYDRAAPASVWVAFHGKQAASEVCVRHGAKHAGCRWLASTTPSDCGSAPAQPQGSCEQRCLYKAASWRAANAAASWALAAAAAAAARPPPASDAGAPHAIGIAGGAPAGRQPCGRDRACSGVGASVGARARAG